MNLLLTNDDGIDAEGLASLRSAVQKAFPSAIIRTVAPAGHMSQVGHRVTTTEPVRCEEAGEGSWAVHGTPADCVRVALFHLFPDGEGPDWVFSGINHGGNLGQDIYISGTVAAVREAAYHGIKGVACSHYMRSGFSLDWDLASRRISPILKRLVDDPDHTDGRHWNVNLPHSEPDASEPEIIMTRPERAPMNVAWTPGDEGLRYTAVYADRPRSPESDVGVCFGGNISLTELRLHDQH